MIEFVGTIVTAATALLFATVFRQQPLLRLFGSAAVLVVGSFTTGALFAMSVYYDRDINPGPPSGAYAEHAFVGISIAVLFASTALTTVGVVGLWAWERIRGKARHATPGDWLIVASVASLTVVGAAGLCFLAFLFWFGGANW